MTKTISCIIPTFNRKDYLKEAVISVVNQSFPAHEIIIVNNGTQQVELPTELLAKVKIFDIMPRAGSVQARNFGSCIATGDYLAFLDDDDLWSVDYLKNVAEAIETGATVIASRVDLKDNDTITPYRNPEGKATIKNFLTVNPGIYCSNFVISKDVFYTVCGFDPKIVPSEDKGIVMEILKQNIPIKILQNNQSIRREHQNMRLTDPEKIVSGIRHFIRLYGSLMNWEEYIYNWKKIYKCRYKFGKKIFFIPYLILGVLVKTIKLTKRLLGKRN